MLGVAALFSFSPAVTAIGAAAACSALGLANAVRRRSGRATGQQSAQTPSLTEPTVAPTRSEVVRAAHVRATSEESRSTERTTLFRSARASAPATARTWAFALLNADDAARLEAFLDRISGLSASELIALCRDAEQRRRCDEFETALAIAEAIIADRKLAVTAWYTRDLVEAAVYVGTSSRATEIPGARYTRAARDVLDRAVLALLVGSFLPRADFKVLYDPVAKYVPIASPSAA